MAAMPPEFGSITRFQKFGAWFFTTFCGVVFLLGVIGAILFLSLTDLLFGIIGSYVYFHLAFFFMRANFGKAQAKLLKRYTIWKLKLWMHRITHRG